MTERSYVARHSLRVSAKSHCSLCQLLERGNLSEKFLYWLSRTAEYRSVWRDIRNYAGLRSNLRTLADPQMPGHSRLPSDADEILKHG